MRCSSKNYRKMQISPIFAEKLSNSSKDHEKQINNILVDQINYVNFVKGLEKTMQISKKAIEETKTLLKDRKNLENFVKGS